MVPKQDKTDVNIAKSVVSVTKVFLFVNKNTSRYLMFLAPSDKTQIRLLPKEYCSVDANRHCCVSMYTRRNFAAFEDCCVRHNTCRNMMLQGSQQSLNAM